MRFTVMSSTSSILESVFEAFKKIDSLFFLIEARTLGYVGEETLLEYAGLFVARRETIGALHALVCHATRTLFAPTPLLEACVS